MVDSSSSSSLGRLICCCFEFVALFFVMVILLYVEVSSLSKIMQRPKTRQRFFFLQNILAAIQEKLVPIDFSLFSGLRPSSTRALSTICLSIIRFLTQTTQIKYINDDDHRCCLVSAPLGAGSSSERFCFFVNNRLLREP